MPQNPAYDKYDPIIGGLRARLGADLSLDGQGHIGPVAVSLNASGRAVVGTAGQSGLVGILIKNVVKGPVSQYGTPPGSPQAGVVPGAKAGDVVDIMQFGEITGLDKTAFPAGTKVYANTAGALSTTAPSGKFLIGFTVEAGRLHVNCPAGLVAQA